MPSDRNKLREKKEQEVNKKSYESEKKSKPKSKPRMPVKTSLEDEKIDGGKKNEISQEKLLKKEYKAPAQPLHPFFFFWREKLKEVPELSGRKMISEIFKSWEQLQDEKKVPFQVMAREDEKRYERQMVDYNREGKFFDEQGNAIQIPRKKILVNNGKKNNKNKK